MFTRHKGKIRFLALLIGIGIGMMIFNPIATQPNGITRPDPETLEWSETFISEQIDSWTDKFTPKLEIKVLIPNHEPLILIGIRYQNLEKEVSENAQAFYSERIEEIVLDALNHLNESNLESRELVIQYL
ncbi:MAG: hypothetical protein Q8P27_00410 [Candidatus Peregrinibacteria bacterium]|nr:hypothetical protein [Candidatus Peregrinibacteria bacterium]